MAPPIHPNVTLFLAVFSLVLVLTGGIVHALARELGSDSLLDVLALPLCAAAGVTLWA